MLRKDLREKFRELTKKNTYSSAIFLNKTADFELAIFTTPGLHRKWFFLCVSRGFLDQLVCRTVVNRESLKQIHLRKFY